MKLFAVCTNPDCPLHVHEVNAGDGFRLGTMGIPLIGSLGVEPTVEDAVVALEHVLENAVSKDVADQIYMKITEHKKTLEQQEPCDCPDCTEPGPTNLQGTVSAVAVASPDDYYSSEEYAQQRSTLNALEVERMKAEIELTKARARRINAEAYELERRQQPSK